MPSILRAGSFAGAGVTFLGAVFDVAEGIEDGCGFASSAGFSPQPSKISALAAHANTKDIGVFILGYSEARIIAVTAADDTIVPAM